MIKKKNLFQNQSRNAGGVFGNKKALNEKKNIFQNQSRNAGGVFGNKKALNEKKNTFHQGLEDEINLEKQKRNTRCAEAFL